jgi:hypothetical protein
MQRPPTRWAIPRSCFTMSNSPLHGLTAQPISFPRRVLRVRVVASASLYISAISALRLPTLRRANPPSPGRPHHLRPRNEGAGGAPGGALPFTVALVRRDATLARRGPSRATGTPPLGAPPWRCRPRNRSGPALRIRPEGCSRPAIAHGGLRHRAFRSRAYRRGRRHSPLRLLDRLRRRPSRARMANLYYNFDMKSIYKCEL